MVLQEKLSIIKLHKGESVAAYLTRVQEVRDGLVVAGEKPIDTELVHVALNGFTKDWLTFVQNSEYYWTR